MGGQGSDAVLPHPGYVQGPSIEHLQGQSGNTMKGNQGQPGDTQLLCRSLRENRQNLINLNKGRARTTGTPGSRYPQEPFQTLGCPRSLSSAVLEIGVHVLHVVFGPCEHLQVTGLTADTQVQPRKASPRKSCCYLHWRAGELQKTAHCNNLTGKVTNRNEKRLSIMIGDKT